MKISFVLQTLHNDSICGFIASLNCEKFCLSEKDVALMDERDLRALKKIKMSVGSTNLICTARKSKYDFISGYEIDIHFDTNKHDANIINNYCDWKPAVVVNYKI